MTRLFLDTEFNSYQGALISMAIVSEDGREFYEVLPCETPHPWVAEHVMPVLDKEPLANREELAQKLEAFLAQFSIVHLITDWPVDLQHFCDVLITGPDKRIDTPPMFMQIIRDDCPSERPHNALADARGIRDHFIAQRTKPNPT